MTTEAIIEIRAWLHRCERDLHGINLALKADDREAAQTNASDLVACSEILASRFGGRQSQPQGELAERPVQGSLEAHH
jgi:hypothetical protein